MEFNYQRPSYVPLEELLPRIRSGWLAQYRGRSLVGQWIQMMAAGGPHTHSALLAVDPDGVLVLELREFIGGRILPLEAHAKQCPGRIDLFSPDTSRWPEFDGRAAVRFMRRLVEQRYNYRAILDIALRHTPLLWRLFPIDTRDKVNSKSAKSTAAFCSQAVSIACSAGGVDPCPRLPHWLTEPSHLTRSLFWRYEGSIQK